MPRIYLDVQAFCVAFAKVKEAVTLFQLLKENMQDNNIMDDNDLLADTIGRD